ncbi:MAG: Gx transporter family protein [Clostridiales bacterium]|nr:Gx transporter family protein [Clostridiales bacterium]
MEQGRDPKKNGRAEISEKIRRMALMGLLFAMALVLAAVENQIQIPVSVPGVKLGLSNIVVMYSLFFVEKRGAVLLAVLKALFVFLTRGAVAAFLSLCGGLLSVLAMAVCLWIFKEKISYFMVSVIGAVCHNAGQVLAISLIYTNISLLVYFPLLLISGIAAGAATSVLLRVTMPALKRIGPGKP